VTERGRSIPIHVRFAHVQANPHLSRQRDTSSGDVASRVSSVTTVCAPTLKDVPVAPGCRTAAGLPPPSPLDDRRAMVSWARMAPREHETRTGGLVAWSLAVGAEDRAKPVMDAYIDVIYAACRRSWQTPHRCAGPHTESTPPCASAAERREVRGQGRRGPHPVGMAPALIREHL